MTTKIHFVDVGQGNMTLLQLDGGKTFLYDCNVTDDNEEDVLGYLSKVIHIGTHINVFINSHRDADHMRGINKVHEFFPVDTVWDSGVTGNTPNSPEYREYMALRRNVGYHEVKAGTYYDNGRTKLRILNSQNDKLPEDPNAQSIVIKVSHLIPASGLEPSSAMLTGDTDAATWKDILKRYKSDELSTSILLASHHGSLTFFDDPADTKYYYEAHMRALAPAMTIISVSATNPHGHPDPKAIELYEKHSTGSKLGNKIKRTDEHGSQVLELLDNGSWILK